MKCHRRPTASSPRRCLIALALALLVLAAITRAQFPEETFEAPDYSLGSSIGDYPGWGVRFGEAAIAATASAAETPENLVAEAEAGTLSGTFVTVLDAAAGGGAYVHAAAGSNTSGGLPPGSVDYVELEFQIAVPGTYQVRGHVFSPATGQDSFHLEVVGEPGTWVWHTRGQYGTWFDDYARATTSDDNAGYPPLGLALQPGAVRLRVHLREKFARLDRVELVLADPLLGEQSLRLVGGGDPQVEVERGFTYPAGESIAFVDFYTKPVCGDPEALQDTLQVNGSLLAFGLDAGEGAIYALDSSSYSDVLDRWEDAVFRFPLESDGRTSRRWLRITVRQDTAAGTWDLYIDGVLFAADLGLDFPEPSPSEWLLFGSESATGLYADNLSVSVANPLPFDDDDRDGIDDVFELINGGDPGIDDRDTLLPDGTTLLENYITKLHAEYLGAGLAQLQLDSDDDGMPDLWEITYGLDPSDPGDANIDLDRDGYTNLQEFTMSTTPKSAPLYDLIEIHDSALGPGASTYVRDVNDDGTAVGYSYAEGEYHPFIWNADTGFTPLDLGAYPEGVEARYVIPRFVDHSDGVGGTYRDADNRTHAFLLRGGILQTRGAPGERYSYAGAMSRSGLLAGNTYGTNSSNQSLYTLSVNGARKLYSPPAVRNLQIRAVSLFGRVVGSAYDTSLRRSRAFSWQNGFGWRWLVDTAITRVVATPPLPASSVTASATTTPRPVEPALSSPAAAAPSKKSAPSAATAPTPATSTGAASSSAVPPPAPGAPRPSSGRRPPASSPSATSAAAIATRRTSTTPSRSLAPPGTPGIGSTPSSGSSTACTNSPTAPARTPGAA